MISADVCELFEGICDDVGEVLDLNKGIITNWRYSSVLSEGFMSILIVHLIFD